MNQSELVFGRITKKSLFVGVVLLVVIAGAAAFIFGSNDATQNETRTVSRGDFIKEVSVSGRVVASENVDLSFAETGRVANLAVKVGDQVEQGQVLASLSVGTLQSELASARATLAQRLAEGTNTQDNLQTVTKEQDTLVASAYRTMLSNDLVAVPSSSTLNVTPPTITGLYDGEPGQYKIIVRRKVSERELLTFELERTPSIEILDDEATPLGTRGLFISFPENISAYDDSIWYISIPNTKSSSYISVYNNYQEALRTRDREITNANSALASSNTNTSVSQAEIQSAQADIARIQSQIAERTIIAPFAGIITKVDAKLGGVASANATAISLISADTLEIESYVPEIHVPFIKLGDPALVTLDAYGSETPFMASVISIDPAETIRDGVSTYRAKIKFNTKDDRVKSGMTANVIITSERKSDVISIPQGAIITHDGQKFVVIKNGESTEERLVTLGSLSSLGEYEITSGLNEGDVVVLNLNEIVE